MHVWCTPVTLRSVKSIRYLLILSDFMSAIVLGGNTHVYFAMYCPENVVFLRTPSLNDFLPGNFLFQMHNKLEQFFGFSLACVGLPDRLLKTLNFMEDSSD